MVAMYVWSSGGSAQKLEAYSVIREAYFITLRLYWCPEDILEP
jgi:hypothetical protein